MYYIIKKIIFFIGILFTTISQANNIVNGDFELGEGKELINWYELGDKSVSYREWGGYKSDYRLTHWADDDYKIKTWQTITNLKNATYTFSLFVKSGGGQEQAYVSLSACVEPVVKIAIKKTDSVKWKKLATTVKVINVKECVISIVSEANANNWLNIDNIKLTKITPKNKN